MFDKITRGQIKKTFFFYSLSGFTDVQTLILAGIATLIPLLIAVATILGVRFLWRRYRERKGEGYEGVLQREESSDPLGKVQGHSLPQEVSLRMFSRIK